MSHDRRRRAGAAGLLATIAVCVLPALPGAGCASDRPSAEQLRLEPEGVRIARAREVALEAQRADDPDDAIALYTEALSIYPSFPAVWNNLGVLYLDEHRYLEAAEAFAAASDHSPVDARPLYNLGLCWERAGYLPDALRHYTAALERDPRYLPALRGAIRAERRMDLASEATLDRIRMALLLEPDPSWRQFFELQRASADAEVRESMGLRPGDRRAPDAPPEAPEPRDSPR